MKKQLFITYASVALALLIVQLAGAALIVNVVTDEFSVESPYPRTSVKACECGLRADQVEVTNRGDFDTLFSAQVLSPLKDSISLSEQSFALKPGESKTIFVYINAPCDSSITSYYVVKVSTNYGRSKEIYKDFESKKCQNIKLISTLLNQRVNPGDAACTSSEVENVAEFTDVFNIMLDPQLQYTTATQKSLELAAGERAEFLVCTRLPDASFGKYSHGFTVSSEKAKSSLYASQEFEVLKSYDYAIKTESLMMNVCAGVTTDSIVTLQNFAGVKNKYSLSLKGPSFASLSQAELEIDPRTYERINLELKPKELDIGEYELSVAAKSESGSVSKEKKFKVTVENCFASSANINQAQSAKEKDCCGLKAYNITLVNKGKFDETYQVIIDSEGWLSIAREFEFVRLKPGEQALIPVIAKLPCVDDSKTSFVTVRQVRAPFQSYEFKVELESLSQRTCRNVELVSQSISTIKDSDTITLMLKNTGLKGANYSLTIEEPDSRFASLLQDSVSINPGELQAVQLRLVNASEYKAGRYLKKLTLSLDAGDGEGVVFERQFWVELRDKSFFSKAANYLKGINYKAAGACGFAGVTLFILILAAIAALFFMKSENFKIKRIKAMQIKKLKILNLAMIGLVILLLIAVLFMSAPGESRLYEPSSNKSGPLFHEWKANSDYTIELSKYFIDPDADYLTFKSTQPDHIQVRIEADKAILRPERGWSGTEYIAFTAEDGKGGLAHSKAMELHVIKKKPLTWKEFIVLYCTQINLVMLMGLIILFLAGTDVIEEKGYRKYLPKSRR